MEEEYLLTDYFYEKLIPAEYSMFFNYSNGKVYFDYALSLEGTYMLIATINDLTGDFGLGSDVYYGSLGQSYGNNKCVGIKSKTGNIRWRIDYDEKNGVHLHYENFSLGKNNRSIKVLIPLNISFDGYKKIVDRNNKRVLNK